jgi:hypothetical protein
MLRSFFPGRIVEKEYTTARHTNTRPSTIFWQFIYFTDEAHLDPSSQAQGCILRERGTRTDAENIQKRGEKTGVELHIYAWVNWWGKSEKLYFYHDKEGHVRVLHV